MLLDHGHANALRYPVGKVFVEASLITKRLDVRLAAQVSFLQMALSTVPNMNVEPRTTNKTAKQLAELLKDLTDGE